MVLRKATIADIDLMVQLRIDYLLDQNAKESLGNLELLTEKLRTYFVRAIEAREFFAVFAEEEKEVTSVGFLSVVERPPRAVATSYRIGTVYNVYTYPQYRKRGMATAVMYKLLQEAEEMDIASVDLLASGQGRPIYEKIGFKIPKHTYMKIIIDKFRNLND